MNSLRKMIASFIDLADMLETYAGLDKNKFIGEDEFFVPLIENDILWSMADQNGMTECEMKDWIWDHISQKVKCAIVKECGPLDGLSLMLSVWIKHSHLIGLSDNI